MASDGSAKNGLTLLVGGGAAAMVALVVGATLFLGHLASPQLGQPTEVSAGGGNVFKFTTGQTATEQQKPAALVVRTPEPAPTALATTTPVATPRPSYAQRLAQHRKLELALAKEREAEAAAAAAASLAAPTAMPRSVAFHLKPLEPFTPAASQTVTEAPQLPAPTPAPVALASAAQDVSAPVEPTTVYAPDTILEARFINRQEPVYPEIAREQDARGTAIVLITIGPKGNVISARIGQSTGFAILDNAALDAARTSTFQAPVIDGKPATATYRIEYDFSP
ncbi:MAG TPA: energy transducer TonB [Candidatus Acidoferrales bacterium]|nr:energy transducer TonB [Candidatus Acidoferrales bacterium]